jgi:tetratricopeptide (TPR) repeat protein
MQGPRLVSTTLAGPGTASILGEALRSVASIVDLCLVLWTGPADPEERAGIERAALEATDRARIVEWPWRADFGAARQAALDLATATGAAWCLWVDTDERIDPRGEDVRATILAAGAPAVLMPNAGGAYYQPRAIRLPCAARWSGLTHESIFVEGPRFARACFVERPKTDEQLLAKRERDLAILIEVTRERPSEPRWWYYLGDTLEGLGRREEAADAFLRCVARRGWDEEAAWASYRAAALLVFHLGRHEEAIDVCAAGLARHPGIAELPWIAGIAAQRLGRHEHAVHWAELARVHGERAATPVRALDGRLLFREPKALREGPADIERWSLRALSHPLAGAAEAEHTAWCSGGAPSGVRVTVTSASLPAASPGDRSLRSVRDQTFPARDHVHLALDGATGDPGVLARLLPVWRDLPDDEVIVWLDGGDRLATDQALAVVAGEHARGAWATYGQFVWADGSLGFAAPVGSEPRSEPWRATHLRTFRAGLAKRIRDDDLHAADGRYAGLVADQRIMLAVLEMAGDRARFVSQVLVVHNQERQFEVTMSPEETAREHAELARVRSFPRYERLARLD